MIPRTIVARPEEVTAPDIIPLPGSRRPERDFTAPPKPPAAATGGGDVGPRDIVNALRYHSVLFVTLGVLVAGGMFVAAWMLVPPKYTTYATLLVEQRNPTITVPRSGSNEDGNFSIVFKTQASMIKNRKTIGGALLAKNGIAQLPMLRNEEDPAAFLEERILIDLTDTTNSALRVALSGDDPVQITQIVNAIVDYYMKEFEALRQLKAVRIEQLRKTKDKFQQELAEKLKNYQHEFAGGTAGETQSLKDKLRMTEYVELVRNRPMAQSAVGNARSVLKAAQTDLEQVDTAPAAITVDELNLFIEKDPDVLAKETAAKRLDRELQAIRTQSSNPDTAKYREIESHLAATKAEIEPLRQKARSKIEGNLRATKRLELTAAVKRAEAEVQRLEAIEQALERRLAAFKDFDLADENHPQMIDKRIPEDDKIKTLREEIGTHEMMIMGLTADLEAPDRVRLWAPADVPSKKDIKKQAAIAGVAGLAGFGLIGGLISVYELRKKRVYGPADPLFRQKLPLLGCVPECIAPAKADAIDPAGRTFFEAVDKVKAVLCRQLQRRKMQVVLVTSAAPGEGKSALAWHLALSLARSDRRTLFIDGNMRNPGLHNHFDIASHPGLSELLRGERMVQEVVQRTALDNLWCVAAGVCDEKGRQALDKDNLRAILDRARRDFDYVIIDSCSFREAVDPLYLAQRADATILAVRAFQSCTADVDRVCDRLTQLGTPLLGAILTDPSGAGCEL